MEDRTCGSEMPYQERMTRHGRELANRLKESEIDWWEAQLDEYAFAPRSTSASRISGLTMRESMTTTRRNSRSGRSPRGRCSTAGVPMSESH